MSNINLKHIYPWQQAQWDYLLNRQRAQNLPHALLFSGSAGLGKVHFAKIFAKLLLCEKAMKADDAACGVCVACRLLNANTHPDFYLIEPEELGKAIKIEQIRELIAKLAQTSSRGGYRVVIINPADAMNKSAANALLKVLEEPLTEVIFMLVTAQASALPATILSRCQRLVFSAPKTTLLKQWLVDKLGKQEQLLSDEQFTAFLGNFSNNAPLKILQLATAENFKEREQLFANLKLLVAKQLNVVAYVEKNLNVDMQLLVAYFMSIISDIIKVKFNLEAKFLINIDKLTLLQNFAVNASLEALQNYLAELLRLNELLQTNITFNKQLLLEKLWLSCPL